MIFINRTLVVFIVFGLGMGMGLRFDSEAETPKPMHSPAQKPDLKPSVQPAVQDLAIANAPTDNRAMFKAICLWEHRGVIRIDDVSCAGAVGPAQITPIFLKDMNVHLKTSYTLDDCKDYEVAYLLTVAYWAKYNLISDEARARCHLAGPRAMTRQKTWKATSEYWSGVKQYLDK